jgi:ATP-dependent helicase/nuclease subunit A
MVRNWTTEQQWAIDARGGNLLVSAAAGSGKTAVLVERVIRRLTDPEQPLSADRLLVVTFTRAAAAEIRQRIGEAVAERLEQDPDNEHLAKQQMLLPFAKICTIDAFCSALVHAHFEKLDLPPDFKNADEGELQLLCEEAMSETLEACYADGDRAFLDLVELLFRGRDDSFLEETVRALYRESRSYPFPAAWLREVAALYRCDGPLSMHPFVQELTDTIAAAADSRHAVLEQTLCEIAGDALLEALFGEVLRDDLRQLDAIRAHLGVQDFNWDAARGAALGYSPMTRPRVPREHADDPAIQRLIRLRYEGKDLIRKRIAPLFCCSEAEFREDLACLRPMIERLAAVTQQYTEAFDRLKAEKQAADFDDVMHAALRLLCRSGEHGAEPTDLAREIAREYDEILIDEYQDTNRAQDLLFSAISRANLFRVGDLKQSIYRFRQAMPEIFMELREKYAPYRPDEPAFPAKITLNANFRSRRCVTEAVNFVFSQIMSRDAGDVDYDGEERLVYAADYPQAEECCEWHLLDLQDLDTEVDSGDAFQADYTAGRIRRLIDDGLQVKGETGMRPARFSDFCVLLRSINGGRGALYADALRRRGIPCFTEVSSDFFAASEVSLLLNLLRVIDNPRQDVPLLSVLLSVLFGFTPDDCAALRLCDPESDLYGCLVCAAGQGNQKAARFLAAIADWRTKGVCMSVQDFLQMIYDETAVPAAVSVMPGAAARRANLMLLLDYAAVYESAGYIGLSGFIRFIDRLERTRSDLAGSVGASAETNVVRVMSIHKSKGLEFPVVLLANCGGAFNADERRKGVVIHSALGVGAQRRELDTLAQFPTLGLLAVRERIRRDAVSEEMRVLYVAMTRARERLILVGACRDLEKTLAKYQTRLSLPGRTLSPYEALSAGSYADWLRPALLRHPDAAALREKAGMDASVVLPADFRLQVFTAGWQPPQKRGEETALRPAPDMACYEALRTSLSWQYPFEPLTKLVSKRAASEVDKAFVDRDYFASARPAFLTEGGLTAAQRGTATHTFMQFCEFAAAERDVGAEIARLSEQGVITAPEAQAIDRAAVQRFFESDLWRRMRQSPLVMREKKFTVELPVADLYPEMTGFPDEKVMIQGIADCAFLEDGALVVVDYKTDRLDREEQFAEKYAGQVRLYKTALSLCTAYRVRETVLYSFHLHRAIPVDG